MLECWRYIGLQVADASTNMALDEAILRSTGNGSSPNTLRLYRWKPSAVSIGYFQFVEDEVDLERCRVMGFDVVRRLTGGGAVYHDDLGELTYSVVCRKEALPSDLVKSYEFLCGGVIEGLRILGVRASFSPINDILVNGRKISGNAQTRRYAAVLQHGTLLVDANLSAMFQVLRVSAEKTRDKLIQQASERVTTLRREIKEELSLDDVVVAIRMGFERKLGCSFEHSPPSRAELELATKLARARYKNSEWLFNRVFSEDALS